MAASKSKKPCTSAGKHTLLGIGHIHPSSGVVLVQLKISGVPGQAFVVRKVTAW